MKLLCKINLYKWRLLTIIGYKGRDTAVGILECKRRGLKSEGESSR